VTEQNPPIPEPARRPNGKVRAFLRNPWRLGPALLVLAALAATTWLALRPQRQAQSEAPLYRVEKMDLVVNVLESATLFSPGALEIKSQVEGSTQIISVIADGTIITPEDVKNGKVMMELDAASAREKANSQEVTVQSASASYTQAREQYDIQVNQNASDINAAELKVKFARMDLEKYLGLMPAEKFLKGDIKLDKIYGAGMSTPEIIETLRKMDLGGDALQQWRKLQAAIDLAGEEVSRAASTYEWSKKLGPTDMGGAGYITRNDLDGDALALRRRQLDQEQSVLALDIFLKYEFPKTAEKLSSDYREACQQLERARARARAEIAKAEASLKSQELTYKLQKERLDKLNQQIANSTIRATRAGMVVYPSAGISFGRGGGSSDKIEEGSTVRERQTLLTVPDSGTMSVNIKVHEASINKVRRGQRVRITLDGFSDRELSGEVQRIAVLADPIMPWISPDVKLYNVVATISSPTADLKPGMGAKAEIIVATVPGVLAVPVQAVTASANMRFCYVMEGEGPVLRRVETGQSSDNFVEVRKGLREGELVLLHTPSTMTKDVEAARAAATLEKPQAPLPQGNGEKPAAPDTDAKSAEPKPAAAAAADTDAKAAEAKATLDPAIERFLSRLPEEKRAEMRAKVESMTPEERAAMMQRFQKSRKPRGEQPADGQPPAGAANP
jgi:multidrug efflux pump subunit AcrA (membrane-fusion protein)